MRIEVKFESTARAMLTATNNNYYVAVPLPVEVPWTLESEMAEQLVPLLRRNDLSWGPHRDLVAQFLREFTERLANLRFSSRGKLKPEAVVEVLSQMAEEWDCSPT